MGETRGAYRVWWGDLREGDNLEYLGSDWKMILKWVSRKWNGLD